MSESVLDQKQIILELQKEFASEQDVYILHVDDEAELLNLFRDQMSDYGVKTLSASDGLAALEILKERAHEIVMIASDIKMPQMNGFEFRKEALRICPNIPFCIASAHVDREMALQGIELKIAAFLPKPFEFDKFAEILFKEALPKLLSLKEDRELKQGFITDSEDLIEESEVLLLRLEQDPSDHDPLNRYYAIMHTLKGASAFFEPKDLHRFVHAYEEILKKVQRAELALTPDVSKALFDGFDVIKELFNEFRSNKHRQRNFEDLLRTLAIETTAHPLPLAVPNPTAKDEVKNAPVKSHGNDDIRVSVKLLDEFMQLSGEVTVIRNMLNKCVGSIERRFAGDRDVGMLTDLLSELHKINSGVQNKMTEIRKVPLKSVVKTLPRAVRDVAKALGKKVDLQIEGEDLRVDTSIAEVLNNSLLHIIKNSIDHGIETPDIRTEAGKPAIGYVRVSAFSRDEKVFVRISDDGQGLNVESIKSKLIKNGTHTRAQADLMNHADLYAMIFSSGFSTAQQVTEISGRGVGMSMVKDCVDALGGQIVIESNLGRGASFQLELPVPKSVLIASCLGIEVGTRRLSLVQDDIIRVLQYEGAQIEQNIQPLEKSKCLLFEGDLIPIANLSTLLGLPSTPSTQERIQLVVMKAGQDSRRVAIEVDKILDVEDMVIKGIHSTLNTASFYRGITFLDDGSVGLIINTSGVMDAMQLSRETAQAKRASDARSAIDARQSKPVPQALIVSLEDKSLYALPQEYVFRIEEIESSAVSLSGQTPVVPYRGSLLRIVALSEAINRKKAPTAQPERYKVVVVRQGERYFGFDVHDVIDMAEVGDLKTELAQPSRSLDGHFFANSHTVALLNISGLLAGIDSEGVMTETDKDLQVA